MIMTFIRPNTPIYHAIKRDARHSEAVARRINSMNQRKILSYEWARIKAKLENRDRDKGF